jgi:hypothetical protein
MNVIVNVLERLEKGEYINRKQWVPYEVDQLASNEYDAEEERIQEKFKCDLLEQFDINDEKGQKILWAAWRDGHAQGYESIYNKFIEYKDLSDKEIEDLQ